MTRLILLHLVLLACFASACVSMPGQYTNLESRVVDVTDVQSILIQVDHGEVTLLASDDSHISIDGQILFVDELEYQVDSAEKQISIRIFSHRDNLSRVPLKTVIRLPQNKHVKVETDNASVLIQGYQGDVEIASTSGDIKLEQTTGNLTLRSRLL